MPRLQQELYIDAPLERVFALLSEVERMPEWWPEVISIRRTSEGLYALGSTTESVIKAFGMQHRTRARCTAFDPPRRLASEGRSELGAVTRSESELAAEGSGTRLRATFEYTLPGGGMGKLLGGLAEKQARQDFENALRRLKALLERDAS